MRRLTSKSTAMTATKAQTKGTDHNTFSRGDGAVEGTEWLEDEELAELGPEGAVVLGFSKKNTNNNLNRRYQVNTSMYSLLLCACCHKNRCSPLSI